MYFMRFSESRDPGKMNPGIGIHFLVRDPGIPIPGLQPLRDTCHVIDLMPEAN